MPQIIELRDGVHITPLTVFDALDVVEEYLGTDMRQYLEDYFEGEDNLPPDEEAVREYYLLILDRIDDCVEGFDRGLKAKRLNRRSLQERVDKLHDMIRREIK